MRLGVLEVYRRSAPKSGVILIISHVPVVGGIVLIGAVSSKVFCNWLKSVFMLGSLK